MKEIVIKDEAGLSRFDVKLSINTINAVEFVNFQQYNDLIGLTWRQAHELHAALTELLGLPSYDEVWYGAGVVHLNYFGHFEPKYQSATDFINEYKNKNNGDN